MHENTLPVPQNGQGIPVNVKSGQPLGLEIPATSLRKYFTGAK